jgi:hypothetical protein
VALGHDEVARERRRTADAVGFHEKRAGTRRV